MSSPVALQYAHRMLSLLSHSRQRSCSVHISLTAPHTGNAAAPLCRAVAVAPRKLSMPAPSAAIDPSCVHYRAHQTPRGSQGPALVPAGDRSRSAAQPAGIRTGCSSPSASSNSGPRAGECAAPCPLPAHRQQRAAAGGAGRARATGRPLCTGQTHASARGVLPHCRRRCRRRCLRPTPLNPSACCSGLLQPPTMGSKEKKSKKDKRKKERKEKKRRRRDDSSSDSSGSSSDEEAYKRRKAEKLVGAGLVWVAWSGWLHCWRSWGTV